MEVKDFEAAPQPEVVDLKNRCDTDHVWYCDCDYQHTSAFMTLMDEKLANDTCFFNTDMTYPPACPRCFLFPWYFTSKEASDTFHKAINQ
jgi:hypothetical protein